MIGYLEAHFSPKKAEPGASLAIQGGSQGARLTHSHERQYTYVLQSLTLWREISHEVSLDWLQMGEGWEGVSLFAGTGRRGSERHSRDSRSWHAPKVVAP